MSGAIYSLVEQYGLAAIFVGCLFEGETAAILGGFFAHQAAFVAWQAFAVVSLGAFMGDAIIFALGRTFAEHRFVLYLRDRPGFAQAYRLVQSHPNLFVLSNRYLYGLRVAGGLAVGLSTIPVSRFLLLNAFSAIIWAAIFTGLGYFFGLGVETVLGKALHVHHRLLIGLAIGVAALIVGSGIARHLVGKRRMEPPRDQTDPSSRIT